MLVLNESLCHSSEIVYSPRNQFYFRFLHALVRIMLLPSNPRPLTPMLAEIQITLNRYIIHAVQQITHGN